MTAPSDTTPTISDATPTEPRSATGVLAILAAIVAVPLLVLLAVLVLGGGRDGDGAASDVMSGVDDDRIQAVYMANDAVYFGSLDAGSGDWLELREAYILRPGGAAGAAGSDEKDGAASLVPIGQVAGGDGTLLINAGEVAVVQNLTTDSPIAREIEGAED